MILRRIWRWLTNADYEDALDETVCECGCYFRHHRRDPDGQCRCTTHQCTRMVEKR